MLVAWSSKNMKFVYRQSHPFCLLFYYNKEAFK